MCVCVSHTLYPGASEELAELRQTGIVMSFSWSSPDLGNLLNTHSAPKLASWRKCSPCWRGGPSLCNPRITADYLWAGTWPINSQVRPIKKWSGKKKKISIQKSWYNQTIKKGSWIQKEAQRVVARVLPDQLHQPMTKQKTCIHTFIHSFIQQLFIKHLLWFRCWGYSMDKIHKNFTSWILHLVDGTANR